MKLCKLTILILLLVLTKVAASQYIKYDYHEAIIKMYGDSAKTISAAETRYEVKVKYYLADNFSMKADTTYQDPNKLNVFWEDVASEEFISFSFGRTFVSNSRYVLRVRDAKTQQTMTLMSSGSLDSIEFAPGEYEIQDPFIPLFSLKPDMDIGIINQNLSHHPIGKQHKYATLTEAFDNKGAFNMWLSPLKKSNKIIAFSSVDGVMYISDAMRIRWYKVPVKTAIIRGVHELDEGYFYVLVDDVKDDNPIDRVLVYDVQTLTHDVIVLPKNDVYHSAAIKMLDRNNIIAFYSKHRSPSDNVMYKSSNGGKNWVVKDYNVIKSQQVNYFVADVYYSKDKGNPIAIADGTHVIQYDESGKLVLPKLVDYEPNKYELVSHIGESSGQRFIMRNDTIYRCFSGYKGIRGLQINFVGNVGVIVDRHYLLITKNGGLSWMYYPYENVRSEGGIGNIDVSKGPEINIRNAVLLPNHLLILNSLDKVYTLDINGL